MLILVMLLLVVFAVVNVGGIHRPLLGGTRRNTRTKIFVVINDTTKDISKLVSILFFYFVMFLPV